MSTMSLSMIRTEITSPPIFILFYIYIYIKIQQNVTTEILYLKVSSSNLWSFKAVFIFAFKVPSYLFKQHACSSFFTWRSMCWGFRPFQWLMILHSYPLDDLEMEPLVLLNSYTCLTYNINLVHLFTE